jgi:hypothetical protein
MMARQGVLLPPSAALFKPKTLGELLLSQASSTGAWNDINLVISFFKNAIEVESERVKSLAAVTDVSQHEAAWTTLLALYVLQYKFSDRESEWQLIATKAKKFLKSIGIAKPDNILKAFKFELF